MTSPQRSRGRRSTVTAGRLVLVAAALSLVACGVGDTEDEELAAEPSVTDVEVEPPEDADADRPGDGSDEEDEGPRTLQKPPEDGGAQSPTSDDTRGAGRDEADHDDSAEIPPVEQPAPDSDDGRAPGLDGRVIALDPGHNGGNFDAPGEINRPVDAGGFTKPCNTTGTATQDGYRESTFNLEVAEHLRVRLEAAGATVHLTRTDDDGVGPCIDVRGTFGQQVGADLTISIHADGAGADARGFHIIHPATWSGSDPAVIDASHELATVLLDVLVEHGKSPANYVGTSGLVARNDLATLNLSEVPVVLLEAGNMRNPDGAAELRDPRWQSNLADALVDAIERYLRTQAS